MNNKIWYSSPAKYWTDALPMGNGSLGGMFFCSCKTDRIALNHDTLWTGYPRKIKKDSANEAFEKAKELTLGGKYKNAQKVLTEDFLTCWSQAYLPLGDLYIEHGGSFFKPKNYKRSLDIENAVLSCEYGSVDNKITKNGFISKPADVLVYKISSVKPISFTVDFICKLRHCKAFNENDIIIDGVCPSDSDSFSPEYPCNSLIYSENPNERGVCFRTVLKVKSNGCTECKNDKIFVSKSTETVIYLCTKTNFEDGLTPPCQSKREYKKLCVDTIENASKKGYEELLREHIEDFSALYSRSSFTLNGKSKSSDIPTDKRLYAFKKDRSDLELYSLFWSFAKYLTISSSREGSTATNLQGIWSENLKAPWNSNYTININTEMNYWPTLAFNLPELVKPLHELVRTLSITGEDTARSYYNAGGFVAHHNSDIWGFTAPTLGDTQWGYWPGGSGWLCHSLYEYYEYTLDEKFLKEYALPIIRKAAEFYSDILVDIGSGLSICPATSPENTFHTSDGATSVAKRSVILDAIVIDCFENYISACEKTGCCDELYEKVKKQKDKITAFSIGSEGQLLEWDDEYKECDKHHRHVSHLIALHPLNIISEEKTPELFNACKKTLEIRGDAGTGWSLAWKINFHARLKNSKKALELLNMQLRPVISRKKSNYNYGDGGGTYPNLFDAHPPFQIDGNFGAASGINEMLVQSDGQTVRLLPALPEEWKSGSVKGMRIKGNATVDFSWANGKIVDCKLHTDNKNIKVIY